MEEKNRSNDRNLYGPACALTAYGTGFKPEIFLSETIFPSELIIFKGKWGGTEKARNELKNKMAEVEPAAASFFEQTLLVVKVSKSSVSATQHKEAESFLEQYQDEILRLSKFPNVERVVLRCLVKEGESLEEYSREFMELAFSCGITALM